MWLVVDGYNLTRSSGFSRDYDFNELKNERTKILDLLNNYAYKTSHKVTVVFDGGKSGEEFIGRDNYQEIDIYYSKGGQTADEVIKKIVEDAENPRNIMVVSSDKGITNYVKTLGASTAAAPELYKKIKVESVETGGMTKGEYFEKCVKGYDENADNSNKFTKKHKKRRLNLW